MSSVFKLMLTVALVLACGVAALPAGFAINEQGTRAMAQAMAFVARADDPSAVFFNPAGITQLEGTQFYFGGTVIAQGTTWEGTAGSIESDDRMEFPPHMYFTQQLSDRIFFGFGFFVPYGLSKKWPDEFPGVYGSKNARLLTYCFNPNLAFKLNDRVSFAVGMSVMRSDATLERVLNLQALSNQVFGGYPIDDGFFSAEVSGTGFGWNVAMHAQLSEKVFVGVSYRSHVEIDYDGDLTLTIPTTGVPTIDGTLAAMFPNQPVSTSITMPDTLYAGIGGNVTERFETEFDVQWTNWKDYDELPFTFSQPTQVLRNTIYPKMWDDGWAFRWGNEFHYTESSDLRFGFYYDMNPVPDATLDSMLPDSDRISFQAGYGWHNDHWTFDLAYMYMYFLEREIHNDPSLGIIPSSGTYSSSGHLFGLSLGYKF